MSEFAVTIEKIKSIEKHPNADRLSIATLERLDFQFVTLLNQFAVGDFVVYFPIDSLLPEQLIDKLELRDKLHGSKKNRIRTVKLRKAISQGVVADPNKLLPVPTLLFEGMDITKELGVYKYEAPEHFDRITKGAKSLGGLPKGVKYYDIESVQRHKEAVEHLVNNNTVVAITEKLEGTSYWATYYPDENKWMAGSRTVLRHIDSNNWNEWFKFHAKRIWKQLKYKFNFLKKRYDYPFSESLWTAVYKEFGHRELLNSLYENQFPDAKQITIRGEIIGDRIQGNIYNLLGSHLYVYDIEVDGVPLNFWQFQRICNTYEIQAVPVIDVGQINILVPDYDLIKYASGKSVLADTLREGIVIRPVVEESFLTIGRLQLKVRDPIYLEQHEEL